MVCKPGSDVLALSVDVTKYITYWVSLRSDAQQYFPHGCTENRARR
jgi:hypothetical protein